MIIDVCFYFNPLPSHEGRQRSLATVLGMNTFQSAPLTRGETALKQTCQYAIAISIRSPHTRGDHPRDRSRLPCTDFNPLPSHEGRP